MATDSQIEFSKYNGCYILSYPRTCGYLIIVVCKIMKNNLVDTCVPNPHTYGNKCLSLNC